MIPFLGREIGGVGFSLGLLFGLILQSIMLFGFETWLHERGGWPLLIIGLVMLWSAILASLMLVWAVQKRRRDQAIAAALAEITEALSEASKPSMSDRDKS